MEIDELRKFAIKENSRLRNRNKTSEKEAILTNAIKLSEEVGEVSDEVLKYFGYAREKKMGIKNELSHEIADVIIASHILAESLNVDVEKALKEKMEKIEKRNKKWQM